MKIHAHILAWNESKILPFTLDYYGQMCDKIFIYDNMSTDNSDEIYKRYGHNIQVIKWNSNDQINEVNYIKLKSFGYRQFSKDCDWVIICDCDEFLYHPYLLEKLNEYQAMGITLPKICGHDMVSKELPIRDVEKLLPALIKTGSQRYEPFCKRIIFNPKLDIIYGVGAHSIQIQNSQFIKESETEELKLLHYKFLGHEYIKERYTFLANRVSQANKEKGFADHYFHIDRTLKYIDKLLEENYQVIQ
jgi:glycosyltransferase involved in cell wall biosynthesis